MAPDPEIVGKSVKQHRLAAGLKQKDLAEKAGLADETISRIESGREPPSLRTAIVLADALGVSLDALVGRVAGPPAAQVPTSAATRLAGIAAKLDVRLVNHLVAIARALQPSKRRTPR